MKAAFLLFFLTIMAAYANPAVIGRQNLLHRSDGELSVSVYEALNTEEYRKITATVDQGVALLKGSVRTEQQKSALKERIRNIPGIQAVDMDIKIHQEIPK